MLPTTEREMFLAIAWGYLGTFYTWGGDDPSGFDCSGLVVECAKSVGLLPRSGDYTAAGLWTRWKHLHVPNPAPGDVVFFGKGGRVTHVEICALRAPDCAIGASGGGSQTVSRADAIKDNAFIKVRPIWGRGVSHEVVGIVDLFTDRPPLGGGV
uniref:Putative cell wall hydrolase n=1 Tax=viral metagenome TaxID=1070528 RepID=A0A6M3IV91_9ZZZZ